MSSAALEHGRAVHPGAQDPAFELAAVEGRVLGARGQVVSVARPRCGWIEQDEVGRRTLGQPPLRQAEQVGRAAGDRLQRDGQRDFLAQGDAQQCGQQCLQTYGAVGGIRDRQALVLCRLRIMRGDDSVDRAALEANISRLGKSSYGAYLRRLAAEK